MNGTKNNGFGDVGHVPPEAKFDNHTYAVVLPVLNGMPDATPSKFVVDLATGAAVHHLVRVSHGAAVRAGWWHDLKTGESLKNKRNVPEALCLIHSEISEAMEGHRKHAMDDKLPHRQMIEVELADALIRICDLAGGLELDLGGALVEKMAYNARRPDHTTESRRSAGGKAY